MFAVVAVGPARYHIDIELSPLVTVEPNCVKLSVVFQFTAVRFVAVSAPQTTINTGLVPLEVKLDILGFSVESTALNALLEYSMVISNLELY
jgi:hypothetical protein